MIGTPGPAVAVTRASSAAGSAWRWANALDERVGAEVHVPDHGQIVAGDERRLPGRRDLDVDGLERRQGPGRLAVREHGLRAGADRGRVRVGEHPADAAVELLDQLAERFARFTAA